jgi:hypothetical protein
MKNKNEELDVDYIQSRPLTKKEEKEFSALVGVITNKKWEERKPN